MIFDDELTHASKQINMKNHYNYPLNNRKMRAKDKRLQMGRDIYFMYRRQIKHSEILIKTEKSVGIINKSTIKVART